MKSDASVAVFLVGIGVYMLFVARMTRVGRMKEWFAFRPNPVLPKDIVYGATPLGIGFILAGLGFAIGSRYITLLGLFGGGILGFAFMFWKPRWLKPDWLLQLEHEYGPDLAERMLQNAQPVWVSSDESPKSKRLAVITIGSMLMILFSGIIFLELTQDCVAVSETECRLLWGITIVSVIGSALLLETLIRRKRAISSKGKTLSSLSNPASQYIIYIVIFGLLITAPLIMRGAVVLTFCGALAGLGLDFFVRGVLNWLPPMDDGS
jgi:hypothetical protein